MKFPAASVTPLVRTSLWGLVVAAWAGCGDAMLPSDYAGPPASAVRGDVSGASADAERPNLSLQWLERGRGNALVGQALSYQRSPHLKNDWDIGLSFPAEATKLDTHVAQRPVRLSVAKMVYFDDRNGDGRLDWGCRGEHCDLVKAVSAQFVVYVDAPPTCTTRTGIRPRLAAGYHYYAVQDGVLRELGANEPLSFTLADRPVVAGNPAGELRDFLQTLLWTWNLAAVDGC